MHRQIVWAGQVPLETDLLNTNRHAMIALGMLTQAILGAGTYVDGLACTPGSGLAVSVGLGSIYSLAAIDATTYSSLAASATQIAKQGILLAPVSLSCPAPTTPGQSINYLVEVQFQEVDGDATVLPYYNSANPAQAWSGPGGSGTASNTTRKDVCAVQIKAGTAATTSTQTTPSTDSGWTALYVVTVAYGAASISAGNIVTTSGAPFITIKLPQAAAQNIDNNFAVAQTVPNATKVGNAANAGQIQSNALCYAQDTGTAGVYQVAYTPAIIALTDGMLLEFEAKTANPGASTFNPNGLGAKPIIGGAHIALQQGEIVAGGKVELMYHAALASWVLLGCTGGALQIGNATQSQHAVTLGQAQALATGAATPAYQLYFMGQI